MVLPVLRSQKPILKMCLIDKSSLSHILTYIVAQLIVDQGQYKFDRCFVSALLNIYLEVKLRPSMR